MFNTSLTQIHTAILLAGQSIELKNVRYFSAFSDGDFEFSPHDSTGEPTLVLNKISLGDLGTCFNYLKIKALADAVSLIYVDDKVGAQTF